MPFTVEMEVFYLMRRVKMGVLVCYRESGDDEDVWKLSPAGDYLISLYAPHSFLTIPTCMDFTF